MSYTAVHSPIAESPVADERMWIPNGSSETNQYVRKIRKITAAVGSTPDLDSALSAVEAVASWEFKLVPDLDALRGDDPKKIHAALERAARDASAAQPVISSGVRDAALRVVRPRLVQARKDAVPGWLQALEARYGVAAKTFTSVYVTGMETDVNRLLAAGGKEVDRYNAVKRAAKEMDETVATGFAVVGTGWTVGAPAHEFAFRTDGFIPTERLYAPSGPFGYSSVVVDLGMTLSFPSSVEGLRARLEGRKNA